MNAGAWGSADAGRLTPEPSRWKSGRVAMSGNLGLRLLPPLALELGRGQVVGRIMETLVVPLMRVILSTHSPVFSSTCSAARPHQGLEQQLPRPPAEARPVAGGWLVRDDRLGGLIHEYRWAA
jgi:hypothetical protein